MAGLGVQLHPRLTNRAMIPSFGAMLKEVQCLCRNTLNDPLVRCYEKKASYRAGISIKRLDQGYVCTSLWRTEVDEKRDRAL